MLKKYIGKTRGGVYVMIPADAVKLRGKEKKSCARTFCDVYAAAMWLIKETSADKIRRSLTDADTGKIYKISF